MPTSEANTATLKNTNTALGTEEESSKASVCVIMTQDQCLDNVHQATSNIYSTNDQVSDDLKKSKNNIVSNGVNNVEEVNVDVNSKRSESSANVAFVQNCSVDADSPPAGKVLTTSEHSAAFSTEFGNLKKNPNNIASNIDANKSECANNSLAPDMTVITHQNSSENIRDIIANSGKSNKVPNESQLPGLVNNVKSGKNSVDGYTANKSGTTKKRLISSKIKQNNEPVTDQPEDPIQRLNKLRASISNALSEVKGVLKQYSVDDENESTPSSKPGDDGPVRFRFVRKIRRRSVFSEEDNDKLLQNNANVKEFQKETTRSKDTTVSDGVSKDEDNFMKISDVTQISSTVSEQKDTGEVLEISNEKVGTPLKDKEEVKVDEGSEKLSLSTLETPVSTQENPQNLKVIAQVEEINLRQTPLATHEEKKHPNTVPAPIDTNSSELNSSQANLFKENINTKIAQDLKPIQTSTDIASHQIQSTPSNLDSNEVKICSSAAPLIAKSSKPKKLVKKDRRASIAAPEVNKISADESLPELELKTQRRPSDSGTLVKQSTRTKVKTKDKVKSPSQRRVKGLSVTNTEVPIVSEPNQLTEPIKRETKPTADESKASAQNSLNSHPAVHNGISTTVKLDNSSTTVGSILQIPSKDLVRANDLQHRNNRIESNKETKIDAPAVAKTADLLVKTEASDLIDIHHQTPGTLAKQPDKMSNLPTVTDLTSPEARTNLSKELLGANDLQHQNNRIEPSKETSTLNTTKIVAAPVVKNADLLVKTSLFKTASVVKTEVPKVIESVIASNQPVNDCVEKLTSVNSNGIVQSKSNPSAVAHAVISTTPATEPPVKDESGRTTETIVVQNQSNQKAKTNKDTSTPIVATKIADVEKTEVPKSEDSALSQAMPAPTDVENVQEQAIQSDISNDNSKEIDLVQVECVAEHTKSEEDPATITQETTPEVAAAPPKKKRKAKRKVVIRRIKRKLSKEDTFIQTQEAPSELEICEKEIEENEEESEEESDTTPKQPKSCLKARQFEIGDIVMYAERYKKTQVKWRKGTVIERITSISYKLNIEGDEKPAHISYIKKFTDRKVNFGGKEYLEIDYAQIEEDEEAERNYSIWNHV